MLFMGLLPTPPPLLLSLYLKSAPDSQLCNSVNDGYRCCWSAQVTTGQKKWKQQVPADSEIYTLALKHPSYEEI